MRSDRAYTKRRQVRAERRNARAKRRAKEHDKWPSNEERYDVPALLRRAFRGIQPMSGYDRMMQMERAELARERETKTRS